MIPGHGRPAAFIESNLPLVMLGALSMACSGSGEIVNTGDTYSVSLDSSTYHVRRVDSATFQLSVRMTFRNGGESVVYIHWPCENRDQPGADLLRPIFQVGPLPLSMDQDCDYSIPSRDPLVVQPGESLSSTLVFSEVLGGKATPRSAVQHDLDAMAGQFVIVPRATTTPGKYPYFARDHLTVSSRPFAVIAP